LLLEGQFLSAIKRYFADITFDLVIYSTPPITFTKVINYIKARDSAKSYLLLKDIFPQNAVDLKMIKKDGLIHRYFSNKEKKLYQISDYIGCMSPANVEYIIKHKHINPDKIEVNPNSLIPVNHVTDVSVRDVVRKEYNIPTEAVVCIYGGNLGKPQGIDFLLAVLKSNADRKDCFFVIVGNGTEHQKISNWITLAKPKNIVLLKGLPKLKYDDLLSSCDLGMIFLDEKFTIPNFPSRLLSYLEFEKAVIAATDAATDLGEIMEQNNFGKWALTGDLAIFNKNLNSLVSDSNIRIQLGKNGYEYLLENYQVKHSYNIIMKHFSDV